MTSESASPTPDAILQLGFGFAGSKALLSAVELGLFTTLADGPLTAKALIAKLGLQQRGTLDFLDALVSLDMLERSGDEYPIDHPSPRPFTALLADADTAATDVFLDRDKPSYIGGLLEMANARLYPFWGSLSEALRTGHPQNETKGGENFFTALYQDPDRLKQFLHAMSAASMGAALSIAQKFPWASTARSSTSVRPKVRTRPTGSTSPSLDRRRLRPCSGRTDLQGVRVILRPRRPASVPSGDFFIDPLPTADVLIMGRILHDWSLEDKLTLLGKAHHALPDGGALIVYESIIDDDRRTNTFGMLMSVNMLIETQDGFDYTAADCRAWMAHAGFRDSYVEPLAGSDSMVVAIK